MCYFNYRIVSIIYDFILKDENCQQYQKVYYRVGMFLIGYIGYLYCFPTDINSCMQF